LCWPSGACNIDAMAYQTFVDQAAVQIHLAGQLSDPETMKARVEVLIAPLRQAARDGQISARDVREYLNDIRRVVSTTQPPVGTHQINLQAVLAGHPRPALDYFVGQMEALLAELEG
jgi:hypothetical protein